MGRVPPAPFRVLEGLGLPTAAWGRALGQARRPQLLVKALRSMAADPTLDPYLTGRMLERLRGGLPGGGGPCRSSGTSAATFLALAGREPSEPTAFGFHDPPRLRKGPPLRLGLPPRSPSSRQPAPGRPAMVAAPFWDRWFAPPPAPPPLQILHLQLGSKTDLSRRPEEADGILQRAFAPHNTVSGLVGDLVRGVPNVKVSLVSMSEGLGRFGLVFNLDDLEGRWIGRMVNEFKLDRSRLTADWVRDDGGLTIRPVFHGRGIGSRLFINFIRWCLGTGTVSGYRFIAARMGTVAWSRYPWVRVSDEIVGLFRQRISRLNHEYDLGLRPEEIVALSSLQEVGGFRLPEDRAVPEGLVDRLRGIYWDLRRTPISETDLRRRSRNIGDLALLLGRYEASVDFDIFRATLPSEDR